MKNSKTAQNFRMSISYIEYGPFIYFLSLNTLPAEVKLEDKWQSGPETLCISLSLPADFDPAILAHSWFEWKENNLDLDYSMWN